MVGIGAAHPILRLFLSLATLHSSLLVAIPLLLLSLAWSFCSTTSVFVVNCSFSHAWSSGFPSGVSGYLLKPLATAKQRMSHLAILALRDDILAGMTVRPPPTCSWKPRTLLLLLDHMTYDIRIKDVLPM